MFNKIFGFSVGVFFVFISYLFLKKNVRNKIIKPRIDINKAYNIYNMLKIAPCTVHIYDESLTGAIVKIKELNEQQFPKEIKRTILLVIENDNENDYLFNLAFHDENLNLILEVIFGNEKAYVCYNLQHEIVKQKWGIEMVIMPIFNTTFKPNKTKSARNL